MDAVQLTGTFIDWSSYLLWGWIASLVLVGVLYASQEGGLSRMSLPFMLGTAWTTNRRRAKLIGFVAHMVNGYLFALLYCWAFEELGTATWWLGLLGGLLHGAIVLLVALPLLPTIHPNMATERQGPTPTRWLQPPGFLGLNYGRRTPMVTMVAHGLYGLILGAFYTLAV